MRNILARVPERASGELRKAAKLPTRPLLWLLSPVIRDEVAARYDKRYLAAARSFFFIPEEFAHARIAAGAIA
ncbi:MAG: hypothetical protein H5T84_09500 [Thermoleophilia bacterium]|nr:hypothetical protein [Thermoleophilia bacterium]